MENSYDFTFGTHILPLHRLDWVMTTVTRKLETPGKKLCRRAAHTFPFLEAAATAPARRAFIDKASAKLRNKLTPRHMDSTAQSEEASARALLELAKLKSRSTSSAELVLARQDGVTRLEHRISELEAENGKLGAKKSFLSRKLQASELSNLSKEAELEAAKVTIDSLKEDKSAADKAVSDYKNKFEAADEASSSLKKQLKAATHEAAEAKRVLHDSRIRHDKLHRYYSQKYTAERTSLAVANKEVQKCKKFELEQKKQIWDLRDKVLKREATTRGLIFSIFSANPAIRSSRQKLLVASPARAVESSASSTAQFSTLPSDPTTTPPTSSPRSDFDFAATTLGPSKYLASSTSVHAATTIAPIRIFKGNTGVIEPLTAKRRRSVTPPAAASGAGLVEAPVRPMIAPRGKSRNSNGSMTAVDSTAVDIGVAEAPPPITDVPAAATSPFTAEAGVAETLPGLITKVSTAPLSSAAADVDVAEAPEPPIIDVSTAGTSSAVTEPGEAKADVPPLTDGSAANDVLSAELVESSAAEEVASMAGRLTFTKAKPSHEVRYAGKAVRVFPYAAIVDSVYRAMTRGQKAWWRKDMKAARDRGEPFAFREA